MAIPPTSAHFRDGVANFLRPEDFEEDLTERLRLGLAVDRPPGKAPTGTPAGVRFRDSAGRLAVVPPPVSSLG